MQALYRLLAVLLLFGCSPDEEPVKQTTDKAYFPISIAGTRVELQLALTDVERSKGLMYRKTLAENHGMLFLFNQPGKRSFWMRNTGIPLDLAYFDTKGTLLEIHSLYPFDENSVQSYSEEVLIAVEMNQGWFSHNNILPGAQLDMDALKTAVTRRGCSISDYSLKIAQ